MCCCGSWKSITRSMFGRVGRSSGRVGRVRCSMTSINKSFCGINSAVTLFCNDLVWAMGTGVMASSVSISCSLEGSWQANVMLDLYVGNYRRNRNTYWLLLRNNMGYHCFACFFHSLECSLWFLLCVLLYTCVSLLDQKLQSKEILYVQVESSTYAAIWSWTLPLNIYFLFTQLLRVLTPQRFCLCMCLTFVFLLFVLLSSLLLTSHFYLYEFHLCSTWYWQVKIGWSVFYREENAHIFCAAYKQRLHPSRFLKCVFCI